MVNDFFGVAGKDVETKDEWVTSGPIGVTPISGAHDKLLELAHTPVQLNCLRSELYFYQHECADEIFDGFASGFPIHYDGPRISTEANNLQSASCLKNEVRNKINKELQERRIAGPFKFKPFVNFRISPIGMVPKKAPNEYRLIHHLSYPEGNSVNDYIDPFLSSVQYTSFDRAVEMIQELGFGCLLGKSDIKSAFRILPVRPQDFELLGFQFEGRYYFDKCMPFGCSISCSTFEKFARFLEFSVKRRCPMGKLIHYLDDFLMGGRKGTNECSMLMSKFRVCCRDLGVPVAEDKTEGPVTCICFLGLELDSVNSEIRLPLIKVNEISEKIRQMLAQEKVTLHDMQSLIGTLNFACRAIIPGRPFCRRLIDSTCGLTKAHHHLRVNKGIRQDLKMWLKFFTTFNGVSVFHDRYWLSNVEEELFTDSAAGYGLGFGAYLTGRWTYGVWPDEWYQSGITDDITVLELFPIVVSLYVWGDILKNKKIEFHCDNMAVVQIINRMSSKSESVMMLLRLLTLRSMELNILLKATHVSGASNQITDSLSRLQLDKFRSLAPEAVPEPDLVPDHLWTVFEAGRDNF